MFEHFPERRRFIRSRADLEFQLARITLALSRAPIARRAETIAWFEDATDGLIAKAAPEHREYVAERAASIQETFFGEAVAAPAYHHGPHSGRHGGWGGRTRLQ